MGKFLRSNAACEANHATRKCSFRAEWTKSSWFIGASADYAHKNGRNHFAQILFFSIFDTIFSVTFQKPASRNSPFEQIQRILPLNIEQFLSLLLTYLLKTIQPDKAIGTEKACIQQNVMTCKQN